MISVCSCYFPADYEWGFSCIVFSYLQSSSSLQTWHFWLFFSAYNNVHMWDFYLSYCKNTVAIKLRRIRLVGWQRSTTEEEYRIKLALPCGSGFHFRTFRSSEGFTVVLLRPLTFHTCPSLPLLTLLFHLLSFLPLLCLYLFVSHCTH